MTFGLLLLAALAASPGASSGGAAKDILHDDRYGFCNDPSYRLTHAEHRWCDVVEGSNDCPALDRVCQSEPVEVRGPFDWLGGGDGSGDGSPGKGGKGGKGGQVDKAPPEPFELKLPDLSGFSTVLMALLVGAGLFFLIRAIRANLLKSRAPDEPEEEPEAAAPDVPQPAAAAGPIETDVARLLARARASATRGEYDRAISEAYAALLRRLDGEGLIAIHPSRTNGDYTRDLREKPALQGAVRGVFRDVERVHFGAEPATPGAFESVFERVVPIATRVLTAFALCLALGSSLSCTQGGGSSRGDDDSSPFGTRAVIELLKKEGVDARVRRKPIADLDGETRTLVLLPNVSLGDEEWEALLDWVSHKGGTLIVAGVVHLPEQLDVAIAMSTESSSRVIVAEDYVSSLGALQLATPAIFGLNFAKDIEEYDPSLLLRGDAVYGADIRVGGGSVVVLADGALFTNIALSTADNAAFLVQLFELFPGDVDLCDRITGAGASTPLESVDHAKLTPAIAQLLVLLALFVLWKGTAFARPRDPRATSRRAFSDHVRALGLTYARSGASPHVLGLYSTFAIDRLRERMHRGAKRGLVPLAEAIAHRTQASEASVMQVLVDAQSAGEDASPPSFRASGPRSQRMPEGASRASHLALMRELDRYLAVTRNPNAQSRPSPRP